MLENKLITHSIPVLSDPAVLNEPHKSAQYRKYGSVFKLLI
jgi:hypothetical protein